MIDLSETQVSIVSSIDDDFTVSVLTRKFAEKLLDVLSELRSAREQLKEAEEILDSYRLCGSVDAGASARAYFEKYQTKGTK